MATRARSPNYPALGLPKVIEFARRVYDKNHLHKASPAVVAVAMGYTSLNGNSATAISALKKFGLLEDVDKDLKITQDALAILVEPSGSPERARLILKAALRPNLFEIINAEYPGRPPSDDILRSFLLRNGFVQSTVDLPIRAYRETMELVEKERAFYNDEGAKKPLVTKVAAPLEAEGGSVENIEIGDLVQWEAGGILRMEAPRIVRAFQEHEGKTYAFVEGSESGIPMEELLLERKGTAPLGVSPPTTPPKLALPQLAEIHASSNEKEWLRGPLSKGVSYRLIVSGDVGSKEIGKLIKLLEAQKLVLEDDDFSDMA